MGSRARSKSNIRSSRAVLCRQRQQRFDVWDTGHGFSSKWRGSKKLRETLYNPAALSAVMTTIFVQHRHRPKSIFVWSEQNPGNFWKQQTTSGISFHVRSQIFCNQSSKSSTKKYLLQRLLESPPVRRPSLTAPHNDRLSGHLISREEGALCVRDTGKSRASQRARLMEISWNKYQAEIVIKTFHGEKVN